MPGFAFMLCNCVNCGAFMSCNPAKVPSIRVKNGKPDASGSREPLCRGCAENLRAKLVAEGKNPPEISDDAYEPCPEEDVL